MDTVEWFLYAYWAVIALVVVLAFHVPGVYRWLKGVFAKAEARAKVDVVDLEQRLGVVEAKLANTVSNVAG
jgi:hypothetical protein